MTTEFRFITEWQIDAPLEPVYDAIIRCLDWPTWWQGVENVEKRVSGDADGIGSVHRFTWKGRIPYCFTFDFQVTGVVPYAVLEGRADGEVIGTGRWDFSCKNAITVVRYQWQVRTNRRWMNLLAPLRSTGVCMESPSGHAARCGGYVTLVECSVTILSRHDRFFKNRIIT